MTPSESPTTNARSRWFKRLLALVDGVWFAWFLISCHGLLINLRLVTEYTGSGRAETQLPRMTQWSLAVLPEEPWSLVTGGIGLSVGFGLFSLHSAEAAVGRLFRWVFIGVWSMAIGLVLPLFNAFTILSGGPDGLLWDEVLFVVLAASLVVLGIVRLRRRSSHLL